MSNAKIIEGNMVVRDARFCLLVGRFNSFIVDQLQKGALDTLVRHGANIKNIDVVKAPGAFEMPLVAQRLAAKVKYDAIICLGAVIRGGTPHFEYVSSEAIKGLATVSLQANLPVTFGVLTVDSIEQAIERAGTKAGNKGADAALAAIEMVNVLKAIDAE